MGYAKKKNNNAALIGVRCNVRGLKIKQGSEPAIFAFVIVAVEKRDTLILLSRFGSGVYYEAKKKDLIFEK